MCAGGQSVHRLTAKCPLGRNSELRVVNVVDDLEGLHSTGRHDPSGRHGNRHKNHALLVRSDTVDRGLRRRINAVIISVNDGRSLGADSNNTRINAGVLRRL